MQGFTRQEAIALTETTSSRLSYLDRAGIVIPEKYGAGKKPAVIYSWEQLILIRLIESLKDQVPDIHNIAHSINFADFFCKGTTKIEKRIFLVNGKSYLLTDDWKEVSKIVNLNKKITSHVVIALPLISSVIDAIWKAAYNSDMIDIESFKKRAKVFNK
jgi:hypothetical protein